MKVFDTIAAISTPHGKGGVAMIRISGTEAIEYCSKVFVPKGSKTLFDIPSNMTVYGDIFMPTANSDTEGKINIDDGMATVLRAPHSFTGEDTVEITCHGGVLVTESVLSACLAAGCRAAEAGEFTKRAFISGKLSLSEAEALGNLLEAQTHAQLQLSRGGMDGILSKEIEKIYESIRDILTSIYAKIDFPDEDLASLSREEMSEKTAECYKKLLTMADTYRTGRAISEGIRTVICGRTNAGKSSLYNRFVGRDAAIVTDIEGTTRDILEQSAACGKVTLRLFDTAGLRETSDAVESIGIERAQRVLSEAELVIAMFDATRALDVSDRDFIRRLTSHSGTVIAVLNKCDGKVNADVKDEICGSFENTISLSAKTGDGYDELVAFIERLYIDGDINLREDAVVANARQYASIMQAIEKVSLSVASLDGGEALDLCCIGLEDAMSSLGEIDGREVTEDIVSQIFAHFCVGK